MSGIRLEVVSNQVLQGDGQVSAVGDCFEIPVLASALGLLDQRFIALVKGVGGRLKTFQLV